MTIMARTNDIFWFQNPNSGWPMHVVWRGKHAEVVAEDGEDSDGPTGAPASDEKDADAMTAAVQGCKSAYDAALVLKRDFGADDIFD